MPKTTQKKRNTPIQKTTCCICLKQRSTHKTVALDTCRHRFCKSCITKWSKRENTCPQCRTRFHKIGEKEVPNTSQVHEEDLPPEIIDYIKELTVQFICSKLFQTLLLIGCRHNIERCLEIALLVRAGIDQIEHMDFLHTMTQRQQRMFQEAKTQIIHIYET